LASEAAQHVNAQILHVARGTVGIMQQPAIIRAFKTDALWSLAQLDQVMPKLLDAGELECCRPGAASSAISSPASLATALTMCSGSWYFVRRMLPSRASICTSASMNMNTPVSINNSRWCRRCERSVSARCPNRVKAPLWSNRIASALHLSRLAQPPQSLAVSGIIDIKNPGG
jgi:hypothetical protein